MRVHSAVALGMLLSVAGPFEFSLPSPGGPPVRSSDLRGRPVAVVLWGSWSPPSRLLARTLVEISSRPAFERLAFVGVHFESGSSAEKSEAVRRFAAECRIPFPLALGDEGFRKRVRGFRGYPAILLLDEGHRPVSLFSGYDEKPETRIELERRLLSVVPRGSRPPIPGAPPGG